MREWLKGIDSSFTCYFGIFEDNYDTVDQICRLYAVASEKNNPALLGKFVDPIFFDDNQISSPEHRRLFKKWFAKRMGQDYIDDEAPSTDLSAEPSVGTADSDATPASPAPAADRSSAPLFDSTAHAQKSSTAVKEVSGWGGYGAWSSDAWNGSSWWDKAGDKDEKSGNGTSDAAWTNSSWGYWGSSDKWK
jgi:hypothetical protein